MMHLNRRTQERRKLEARRAYLRTVLTIALGGMLAAAIVALFAVGAFALAFAQWLTATLFGV